MNKKLGVGDEFYVLWWFSDKLCFGRHCVSEITENRLGRWYKAETCSGGRKENEVYATLDAAHAAGVELLKEKIRNFEAAVEAQKDAQSRLAMSERKTRQLE